MPHTWDAERIAAARMTKALALVREIRKATLRATQTLTDDQWNEMAKAAGVNAPSQTTTKLVIDLLEG